MEITQVWRSNFHQQISSFDGALHRFRVICLDTELPGFLRNTPKHSPDHIRYHDLKYNVENTKIIHLGITLSNEEGNCEGGTWEFNFSDFDMEKDSYMETSI
ncbi:hypothetical protein Patl1_32592 [Pistacia atlantica]|uniref:Uncharacterized protein n=1 Tax=Pistacia atlantica TaxID=434234 RepID=A0ACC1AP90_9ROSI|nr:hypothetical protein Patl1_32592 [Pistacia atlantica]